MLIMINYAKIYQNATASFYTKNSTPDQHSKDRMAQITNRQVLVYSKDRMALYHLEY